MLNKKKDEAFITNLWINGITKCCKAQWIKGQNVSSDRMGEKNKTKQNVFSKMCPMRAFLEIDVQHTFYIECSQFKRQHKIYLTIK